MCRKTLIRFVRLFVPAAMALLATGPSAAQTPPARDVAEMSMQDLLGVEVVSSASKFPQDVKEAPASITVVSRDEIRHLGHRTLADILRGVRGFYTTYDRTYSYVGVRGFSRPGDYNTRVLLLVDGQRLNDPVYDMAPIGTDFPIDVSLIDRVEVIRGPGSSLYGTNAFFAVVNVITRTGSQTRGIQLETYGGSLGTGGGSASVGRLFEGGRELLLSASLFRSRGAELLHYPEFDSGTPGSGVAVGLDHDEAASVFGSMAAGRVVLRGGVIDRHKQVPTASFDSIFGDDRLSEADRRGFVSATYEGTVGRGWSATGRLAYDYYGYTGTYPYDYGEPEPVMSIDRAESHTASGEVTLRRRLARSHLLSVGTELRHQLRSQMSAEDNSGRYIDVNHPLTMLGAYVQDEFRVLPWLLLNAGARLDHHESFGTHAAPRVGAVLLPRAATAVKVLHGAAFRAPNPYELRYYEATQRFGLEPETIRQTEIVWEEDFSNRVRTALTAFHYRVEDIIELNAVEGESDPGQGVYFRNEGTVRGSGFEAEIEVKLARGISSRASHAHVRTTNAVTGERVSNSPRNLSKLAILIPAGPATVGVEGQFTGERLTLAGGSLPAFFVPNARVTAPLGRRVDLSVAVYNAFNTAYSDPGGEEHVMASIRQDGRTFLAKLRARF